MIRLCYPCVFSPLPRSTFPPFPFLSSEHHVRQLTTSPFWKHPLPLARNTYSPDFLYVSGSPQFPFFAHTSPLGVIPDSITSAFYSHAISLLRHSPKPLGLVSIHVLSPDLSPGPQTCLFKGLLDSSQAPHELHTLFSKDSFLPLNECHH